MKSIYIYHVVINQKKACVAMLILYKEFIRTRNITMDKDEYFIMTKGSIQEDIIMCNVYTQITNCETPGTKSDRTEKRNR